MSLWDRQPGESSKAFAAFSVYRDMGPERSLRDAVRIIHKSLTVLGQWSSRWSWVARAQAWDDELDKQARKKHNAEIANMRARHAQLARSMQTVVAKRLLTLKPEELDSETLRRMLDTAAKLERTSMGEPETIQEQRHEHGARDDGEQRLTRFLAGLAAARDAAEAPARADAGGAGEPGKQLDVPPAEEPDAAAG